MKSLNSHVKIVLIATLFNICAEYSLRGISNLHTSPILPIALFLNYFPYFMIIEHLITRYHMRDYHVAIVSLFYGILWQLIGPSIVYLAPFFLGVNWIGVIFVNFVWWVPIQTLLALYLANRFVKREWNVPFLTQKQYHFYIGFFVVATMLFRAFAPLPATLIGTLTMVVLTIIAYRYSQKIIKKLEEHPLSIPSFVQNKVYDVFSVGLVLYFIIAAVGIRPEPGVAGMTHLNVRALQVDLRVSTIVVLILFFYRKIKHKPISV